MLRQRKAAPRPAGAARRPGGALNARSGIASIEFALIAPALLSITLIGVDGARAVLIWRQVHNAATAIAENAEKLSVTTIADTNDVTSELTADQMQQAMSTIYAVIPGLNLGNGGGLYPGKFAVTMSEVPFYPICAQATGCATQSAYVLWSSYLSVGGPQLTQGIYRPCQMETSVAAFPDNASQYTVMANPNLAPKGSAMTVAPEVVVDVQYTFTPYFPLFVKSTTFYASAVVAAPLGGLDQITAFNTAGGTGNVVTCNVP
jgi:Flp pilus assembly protein TadG